MPSEGEEYERVSVPVLLADGAQVLAWTYRFRAEMAARLLPEPWRPQDFEGAAMARFVAATRVCTAWAGCMTAPTTMRAHSAFARP